MVIVFQLIQYLATKWAETEGIKEATLTDLAGIGDTFTRPRLRPLIQEHNSGTIYYVCLHACNVQVFLNLRHPYHIMIWWPPYLQTKPITKILAITQHKWQVFKKMKIPKIKLTSQKRERERESWLVEDYRGLSSKKPCHC